ncbi:[acyl-carrier-protein] S-malonyltransferase [Apilactobacillus micheneri]|uniref:Malonyl CoA-acyl carrier protein transacylase n=1 Tax=Apilactobacillus micheneri TaxID=1899430 RepID=A0A9Q8IPD0_9LACO|nr:ACP S-malonyltransferase [Apilactobacillus micheneri]TPR41054.1 [acyl-carrier-protein] S-malonyltransferase [Apilactobacillus micheneri]TPR42634.1 [acyl-carrier-protein] S-malonyltransferase [Apilactobacillus micheneri]TPR45602.1 [acyl-carrier-protein] S-malonyltransferase [Apilactobacillus micheneri]TPR46161.1 [acyl-carrier-protein] S-malonyltransferase [Apilactobacillus micheneri]TPR46846.1 [acyl-carrier-protein] S-malonyltransferase [Apilactobacillus micheneri]
MNICYLFSGQGSQFKEMGQDLYKSNSIYKETIDEASKTLDLNLADPDIFDNPNNTQISILTMSVAIYRILADKLDKPVAMMGLSLGEYSALVAAKALSFQSGLKLVHDRSHYMDEAGKQNPGSMAAVLGVSPDFVKDVCDQIDDVYPANYNTKKQTVIGGTKEGVQKAMTELKEKGAKRVIPLKVAVASHTPLMQPASDQLAKRLESVEFDEPEFDVISNTTVKPFNTDTIKETLTNQLINPTHFMQDVASIEDKNIDAFIEIGPGNTLSKLAKKTLKADTYNVESVDTLNDLLDKLGE